MVITHYGTEFFKVTFGDITLAFNPVSKKSKNKTTSFGSNIVLSTINHRDMNGIDQVSRNDKIPIVINGPGEYEVSNVFIKGFQSEGIDGMINTIYLVTLEGMSLCFLGALTSKKLPLKIKEAIDVVDVLFVPIGGEKMITPSDANQIATELGANIIIPMHYDKKTLDKFLKETGNEKIQAVEKLSIKKKDVDEKEGEVVVLLS